MDINEIIKHETDKVKKELEVKNLRDQFAMAALPALIAISKHRLPHEYRGSITDRAYLFADSMIKSR